MGESDARGIIRLLRERYQPKDVLVQHQKVARTDVSPTGRNCQSRDGGSHPVGRPDARELFYLGPDGTMMSVLIGAGPSLDAGLPRALFHANVWFTP